ncbi:hypothetical protein BU26DRAFT_500137 [Trematosphaeria pertusa]|uniref:Uncharacterized protein n=1 Tax=Trematosphaeria pertusa TaxID=390896 RepID=A0A6A6IVG1_9PLEO|nr:uncharacterized protein BU26DRAFT_500137 [Trematosphaeria pertusa]KAF2254366.1 hypothetical protein BU26DRAFT_500137 [Trematosphaeria pertusa]
MTDTADFEQFCLTTLYNAIPMLDNPSDRYEWNNRVCDFIEISSVAEDGAPPPNKDQAKEWYRRQKLYTAMIMKKLSHNAAPRIKALGISDVQSLLEAVRERFNFSRLKDEAIEEEYRSGQRGNEPAKAQRVSNQIQTLTRQILISPDETRCQIHIDKVPFCSFCPTKLAQQPRNI